MAYWGNNMINVQVEDILYDKLQEIQKKEDPLYSMSSPHSINRIINRLIQIFIEVYESE